MTEIARLRTTASTCCMVLRIVGGIRLRGAARAELKTCEGPSLGLCLGRAVGLGRRLEKGGQRLEECSRQWRVGLSAPTARPPRGSKSCRGLLYRPSDALYESSE